MRYQINEKKNYEKTTLSQLKWHITARNVITCKIIKTIWIYSGTVNYLAAFHVNICITFPLHSPEGKVTSVYYDKNRTIFCTLSETCHMIGYKNTVWLRYNTVYSARIFRIPKQSWMWDYGQILTPQMTLQGWFQACTQPMGDVVTKSCTS